MSEELLPCPFCGGVARMQRWENGKTPPHVSWRAHCTQCGVQVGPLWSEEDGGTEAAAEAWNRRPSPPVVDGELPEPGTFVNLTTLKWWRELVDLNPADLAPRLDSQIKMALSKSPRSEGDK